MLHHGSQGVLGQLEGTLLEIFAASGHFKALLHQLQDIPAVHKFSSLLETATKDRSRDPLAGVVFGLDLSVSNVLDTQGEPLSHRAQSAVALYYAGHFPDQDLPSFISCSRCTLGKIPFTTYVTSACDCNIAYTLDNALRPGVIHFIVATKQSPQEILFIVDRYMPLPSNSISVPFSSHADFGVSLWSDRMEETWEVVPVHRLKCHIISSRWAYGTVVVKALDQSS